MNLTSNERKRNINNTNYERLDIKTNSRWEGEGAAAEEEQYEAKTEKEAEEKPEEKPEEEEVEKEGEEEE